MPSTQTSDRLTPEAAVPEPRPPEPDVTAWLVVAGLGAMTVAWVGALVVLAWWLIADLF
jgi:hypothetical protein